MREPDPSQPSASLPAPGTGTAPAGRPGGGGMSGRTKTLVVFLCVFVGLLVVFRSVLFPFLMAIFVAYLVEPVVAWVSRGRRFGVKVGRGPVLLLMYAVVLLGGFLLVSCGVNRLGTNMRRALTDLKGELDRNAPAARFTLEKKLGRPVWIPDGVAVTLGMGPDARTFKTAFPAQIDEGLLETRILLEEVDPRPKSVPPHADLPLAIVDAAALALPEGAGVHAETDEAAKGLEVLTEKQLIAPVAAQIEKVTNEHFDPGILRAFIAEQSREHGADLGTRVLKWGQSTLFTIVGSTYQLILVLMLTAFIVIDRKRITGFFRTLPPAHLQGSYDRLMRYVDRGLAGVIRGQLLICVVNGLLTWVGLLIIGVPYATLLGLLAGIFSLIPVFGTIASSIPIVLVALATGGVHQGLLALGWIGLIHLLEANLFNPLIMGTNAEMHPVIIIFALLAGEHSFGVWGALLAVPTASIIQSCFKYYRHEIEGIPAEEAHGHGQWMRSLLAKLKGRPTTAAGKGPS